MLPKPLRATNQKRSAAKIPVNTTRTPIAGSDQYDSVPKPKAAVLMRIASAATANSATGTVSQQLSSTSRSRSSFTGATPIAQS
jgi:hypothetical protein